MMYSERTDHRNVHGEATQCSAASAVQTRSAIAFAVVILLASGVAYRQLAARVTVWSEQRIGLDPPLSAFPMSVGVWQGEELPVSDAVLKKAQNDDYLSRRYTDTETGEQIVLYVAYTGRPRTMLGHRPSACYPSAGWLHLGTETSEITSGPWTVPCLVHQFRKPALCNEHQLVLNYYVLNGTPSIDENSFSGLRWRGARRGDSASHYVAQIQITAAVTADPDSAERLAGRFASASVPGLFALLPGSAMHDVSGMAGQEASASSAPQKDE